MSIMLDDTDDDEYHQEMCFQNIVLLVHFSHKTFCNILGVIL